MRHSRNASLPKSITLLQRHHIYSYLLAQVWTTLDLLGVSKGQIISGDSNSAFGALAVWIGFTASLAPLGGRYNQAAGLRVLTAAAASPPSAAVEGGATMASSHPTPGPNQRWFSPERASAFWSTQVVRKTFVERRTW